MRPYFEYPLMHHFMQRCLQHWVHRVRWVQIGFLLGMCLLLGACGGGTSNRDILKAEATAAAAEAAKVPVSLYTTAPGSLTFPSGAAAAIYTIGGGVPPYAAGSSNAAVATVTVSQANLNIAVGAVGSADVWILDSVGAKVELSVVVGFTTPSTRLRTTAPDKLTLGIGGSGSYAISGGTPPYQTSSSNTGIVLPAVNGSTLLLVSGAASGAAQVLVTDATGTQLVLEVSVGSATTPVLYTSAPSTLNMAIASVARFTIGGGVPPYAVSSSDAGVATASASGNSLSLASIAAGKATILAIDSVGSSVRFEVTVGGSLRTNAPEKISLGAGNVGIYTVSGGVPPYTASSGAPGIVTAAVNGTNLTLAAGLNAGADVPVVVTDAAGTQLPALLVTVTASTTTAPSSTLRVSAPDKITLNSGSAGIYTILGGTPPYIASSGAPGTVAAAVNGATLTLTGGPFVGADVPVLVTDAAGAQLPALLVTVTANTSTAPGATLRISAPEKITLGMGATGSYTLFGGRPPYIASSGAPGIVTAAVSGATLTLTGGSNAGIDVPVLVTDAAGAQLPALLVTVTASTTTAPGVALRTSAPDKITLDTGSTGSYTISGGSPPYLVSSGAPGIVMTTVNGSAFTLTGGASAGEAQVLVSDATGTQVSITVTVRAATAAALYTSVPSTGVTFTSGGTTASYSIGGGVPPYAASSSNAAVASVLVSGSSLNITSGVTGNSRIVVLDARGAFLEYDVTVGSSTASPTALRTTAPETVTLGVGSIATYTIAGGTPPYLSSSGANAVVTATVSGSVLTLAAGGSAGSGVDVLVVDAAGAKVLIKVTVNTTVPGTALRTSAPDKITLDTGSTGTYTISGGTPPYAVSSGAPGIVTATVNGSTFTLRGGASAGDVPVLVSDATGTQVSITVTVRAATTAALYTSVPSTGVTFASGGTTASYSIGGGVPPYAASSSNSAVASVLVSGSSLNITSGVTGIARIQVLDARGSFLEYDVTVGSNTASPTALRTTAPETVTLGVGNTATYTIAGGTSPYFASSGANAVVTAAVNGSVLTLTAGNSTGSGVDVLVTDAAGARVLIKVTVNATVPGAALRTSAPDKITLDTGSTGTYTISGGTPPYLVSSGAPGIVTAVVNGSTFTLTGGASAGDAQVLVSDATGTQVPAMTVTVRATTTAALYTSVPSTGVTFASGGTTASYSIGGGVPPYAASSSNAAVASVLVSGSSLNITGGVTGNSRIVVLDARGSFLEYDVTVGSGTASPAALRTTAPETVTLGVGNTATYTIAGGTPPYLASSGANAVVTAAVSGSVLTLAAGSSAGSGVDVVVTDAAGARVLIKVTVNASPTASLYTSAPSAFTIASGSAATYSVFGGVLPYLVTSSNVSVATASITGNTLSINGLSVGDATIELMDSGASPRISIAVHVSSRTGAALGVMPSGATGNVGDTLTFTLLGGSPSYSLSVGNTSIASLSATTVAASGGTFTAALLNVGTVTVTVRDALGQTLSFDITVGSVSSQLRLSPSAFVVGENETASIDLKIYGGSGLYTMAFSSDTLKASVLKVPATVPPSVAISGNTLTTSVGSSGNRCINPVTADIPPVYITSGTYDVTFTVLDSLGASATSVMTIKDNGAGLNAGCP